MTHQYQYYYYYLVQPPTFNLYPFRSIPHSMSNTYHPRIYILVFISCLGAVLIFALPVQIRILCIEYICMYVCTSYQLRQSGNDSQSQSQVTPDYSLFQPDVLLAIPDEEGFGRQFHIKKHAIPLELRHTLLNKWT